MNAPTQGSFDMGLIRLTLDRWGAGQPLVKSIYLLGRPVEDGRRVSGSLELGIELDWVASDGGLSLWTAMQEKWRVQIERLLPYIVQLEWYRSPHRNIENEKRARSSIGLYSKSVRSGSTA